jgi:hypothetical protein
MFFLLSLGCAHTMQNEKQPLPVVLYFGKPQRRAIISREAARIRCAEGSATFDKHEKIHRNKQKYFVVTQGRCAQCGIEDEACEPIRVSVLRSRVASRYSAPVSGKHMRVRYNRSGRKIDHDRRLIRDIAPTHAQIVGEMREINQRPGLKAWCLERDHLADDLRSLDLEVLNAKIYGGIEAAKAKRAEQKRLFIECLSRLEKEPGRAEHLAEQIVNYSKFFFPPHSSVLDPFEPFLKELSDLAQCRRSERSELLDWHRTKRRILGVLRRIPY